VIWPEDRQPHRAGVLEERELQCSACGYAWWADGRQEDGTWWPINEYDANCDRCSCEGEA
jgi:hypothetical protein